MFLVFLVFLVVGLDLHVLPALMHRVWAWWYGLFPDRWWSINSYGVLTKNVHTVLFLRRFLAG